MTVGVEEQGRPVVGRRSSVAGDRGKKQRDSAPIALGWSCRGGKVADNRVRRRLTRRANNRGKGHGEPSKGKKQGERRQWVERAGRGLAHLHGQWR